MNLDDSDDMSPDGMAAEYVLGTLDPAEREQAEALIASDPAFARLVGQWERRLGELHVLAGEVEPPPAVWETIAARLPEGGPDRAATAPSRSDNVVLLRARVARWRIISAVTGAVAAVLALFVVTSVLDPALLPDGLRPKPLAAVQAAEVPARFVAVLQKDASAPAFILTVDIASRSLTVRRVAAEREDGRSYELWLVSNRFPAPRSLGLVSASDFTRSGNLSAYDPTVISDATYAVSLEPEGGSPTGAPSNVLFLGKLIEATPPQSAQP